MNCSSPPTKGSTLIPLLYGAGKLLCTPSLLLVVATASKPSLTQTKSLGGIWNHLYLDEIYLYLIERFLPGEQKPFYTTLGVFWGPLGCLGTHFKEDSTSASRWNCAPDAWVGGADRKEENDSVISAPED